MSRPYQPQPGTLPFRAIEHLGKFPPGTEKSTAELAEALGQDVDSVHGCLAQARRRGALRVRKDTTGLKRLYWRLPLPGEALEPEQAEEEADPAPMQQTIRPWTAGLLPASSAPAAAPTPGPKRKAQEVTALRLASWSTGQIAIETADHVFVLNQREAQWLLRQARELPQREAA